MLLSVPRISTAVIGGCDGSVWWGGLVERGRGEKGGLTDNPHLLQCRGVNIYRVLVRFFSSFMDKSATEMFTEGERTIVCGCSDIGFNSDLFS